MPLVGHIDRRHSTPPPPPLRSVARRRRHVRRRRRRRRGGNALPLTCMPVPKMVMATRHQYVNTDDWQRSRGYRPACESFTFPDGTTEYKRKYVPTSSCAAMRLALGARHALPTKRIHSSEVPEGMRRVELHLPGGYARISSRRAPKNEEGSARRRLS